MWLSLLVMLNVTHTPTKFLLGIGSDILGLHLGLRIYYEIDGFSFRG